MNDVSRRDFIHTSTALAAGCALPLKPGRIHEQTAGKPEIKRYKPFGKTGFMVGDISAGSGQSEPGLIDHIFECGVNLIDTAYQYPGHEKLLSKVLPKWRDRIFIIDKWAPELVSPEVTKAELLKQLDEQLARLKTTYIDCLMIHAIGHPFLGDITRIQNPAIYEAWDEAKKMGKIRFTGASSCGVNVLKEMNWGIDNGRFDVIIVGGNFLTHGAEPLLKKARARGVATVAMKTMTIYKSDLNIRALQNKNTNARQAVIKWVLASDLFDTMIIGMRNYDMVSEYLSVSGTTSLTDEDSGHLETLRAAISPVYCRPGCDGCLGSCPHDVPVANILRFKMYFENYGDEKYAMRRYRELPASQSAAVCADCSAPCEDACIYNLPVRRRLIEAHSQLTMA